MGDISHMAVFEKGLDGSDEWRFTTEHWTIMQLYHGIAYIRCSESYGDMPLGGAVICPPRVSITVMASSLGGAKIRGILLRIDAMSGFLTAIERICIETQAPKQFGPFQIVPPTHKLATQLNEICQRQNMTVLSNRLNVFQGFAELLTPYLGVAIAKGEEEFQDAKERMRQLINQTPESEMENLSLGRLSAYLHCCERHARRIFREVCGCSFRHYISELRLKKACNLLSRGDTKIIDVALESGHSSLALFNYLFKKRFKMTPTQWRQRKGVSEKPKTEGRTPPRPSQPPKLGLTGGEKAETQPKTPLRTGQTAKPGMMAIAMSLACLLITGSLSLLLNL